MKRSTLAAAVAAAAAGLLVMSIGDGRSRPVPARPLPVDPGWAELDAQARCDQAAGLVTRSGGWPIVCRWRQAGEVVEGQSFPPPRGAPPYDEPRIEVYVDPAQRRDQVAHAIAHELGHMHHTREPAFVPAWLAARGLPPDTPSDVWTEDYAEVFAALFGPSSPQWRAPTAPPDTAALAELGARFFS